ncbi:unnamed protein product [Linum tenue]|nr:unnamed protein product [Linum tenue]
MTDSFSELIELCGSLRYFTKEECVSKGEMELELDDVLLVREGFDQKKKYVKGKAASHLLKQLELECAMRRYLWQNFEMWFHGCHERFHRGQCAETCRMVVFKSCCCGSLKKEVCGKRLRGPYAPCPVMVPISCACGQTRFEVPCGTEKDQKSPKCPNLCEIPPLCRHGPKIKIFAGQPCFGRPWSCVRIRYHAASLTISSPWQMEKTCAYNQEYKRSVS